MSKELSQSEIADLLNQGDELLNSKMENLDTNTTEVLRENIKPAIPSFLTQQNLDDLRQNWVDLPAKLRQKLANRTIFVLGTLLPLAFINGAKVQQTKSTPEVDKTIAVAIQEAMPKLEELASKNAKIGMMRAQGGKEYYPAKDIKKILSYSNKTLTAPNGKKITISPEAAAFTLIVSPTESSMDFNKIGGIKPKSGDLKKDSSCHGLFQLCNNKPGGYTYVEYLGFLTNTIPAPTEYREKHDLQMMIAELAYGKKTKISSKFDYMKQKYQSEGVYGKMYGATTAWIGLCPQRGTKNYPANESLDDLTRDCGGGLRTGLYGDTAVKNLKKLTNGSLFEPGNIQFPKK